MNNDLTLEDIKKAAAFIKSEESFIPCTCEKSKIYCGICEKHGLLWLNDEEHKNIKRIL